MDCQGGFGNVKSVTDGEETSDVRRKLTADGGSTKDDTSGQQRHLVSGPPFSIILIQNIDSIRNRASSYMSVTSPYWIPGTSLTNSRPPTQSRVQPGSRLYLCSWKQSTLLYTPLLPLTGESKSAALSYSQKTTREPGSSYMVLIGACCLPDPLYR